MDGSFSNSSFSNGMLSDDSFVQNGASVVSGNTHNAAMFVRGLSSNGDNINGSFNGAADSNDEKAALIEELTHTLRETYERMPAHLLQYELVKAKALSALKFS